MNIYDTANNLAREIRESDVFKNLKNARERIYEDPEKKELVEEFDKLKIEVQIFWREEDIKEYFDLQVQFNQMMIDINKIIGDVVKDVF